MSEKSCHAQVCREPFATTDCCPKENDADDAVRRAFARVRYWRIPPHWSTQDWLDEVRAILQSAATSACFDYDKERAVPLRAHLYMRAVAAAWSRHRQEWSYYLHSAIESGARVEPIAMPFDRSQADETIRYFLGNALSHLPVEDQLLVEQLFWNGTRQDRLALMLGVSQQEVSRRKVRVLQLLRRALHNYAALLLAQLGSVCLAIMDDLDVILDLDLDFFC
jgi:DNA-directed RNA polymerase specialized sigma24 family protein